MSERFDQGNQEADPDLWFCTADGCNGEMVYELGLAQDAGPGYYLVTLRCPDCEEVTAGVYSQEQVERLDDELDRGTYQLIAILQETGDTYMQATRDLFSRALEADAIMPEDFGRPV